MSIKNFFLFHASKKGQLTTQNFASELLDFSTLIENVDDLHEFKELDNEQFITDV